MYTIDDFKTKRIAASFGKNQAAERSKFLINCEEAGIKWDKGCEATKFQPSVPCHIACAGSCPGYLTFQDEGMPWWFPSCGITVVPCNDFDFMQPVKNQLYGKSASTIVMDDFMRPAAPRQSICITSDGAVTHCIYKSGKSVVKRTKATCGSKDTYDFAVGARIAFDRMLPNSAKPWHTANDAKKEPAAPEYDEVIRPAKVGEKIKTVAPLLNNSYYEKDEIFTVDNKKNCCSDSVRVKGAKIPVDKFPNGYLLWPSEYVVLVPRNGTR